MREIVTRVWCRCLIVLCPSWLRSEEKTGLGSVVSMTRTNEIYQMASIASKSELHILKLLSLINVLLLISTKFICESMHLVFSKNFFFFVETAKFLKQISWQQLWENKSIIISECNWKWKLLWTDNAIMLRKVWVEEVGLIFLPFPSCSISHYQSGDDW